MLREPDAAPPCGIEGAVAGGGADEPGDVVKRHHPVAGHEPVGGGRIVVEEIPKRPGLGGGAGQDHRLQKIDDRPVGSGDGRIDRLPLVFRLAGEELRHNPLREERFPVGLLQGGDGGIPGVGHARIVEHARPERLDRRGERFA